MPNYDFENELLKELDTVCDAGVGFGQRDLFFMGLEAPLDADKVKALAKKHGLKVKIHKPEEEEVYESISEEESQRRSAKWFEPDPEYTVVRNEDGSYTVTHKGTSITFPYEGHDMKGITTEGWKALFHARQKRSG